MFRWFVLLALISTVLDANTVLADQVKITDARKAQIQTILLQDCGSCHGMTLQGGLGPAITVESVRTKSARYLFNTIRDGLEGTPMPPWLGIFTELEIHYLVKLLKQGKVDA